MVRKMQYKSYKAQIHETCGRLSISQSVSQPASECKRDHQVSVAKYTEIVHFIYFLHSRLTLGLSC